MSRPSPIEREPSGNSAERDRGNRMNILRNPDVTEAEQKQVADALNVIAESDHADALVRGLGLQTDLKEGPVHDFLVNNGPGRVGPLFDAAFKKAEAELRANNDVEGILKLKEEQASVTKILRAQTGRTEIGGQAA